MSVVHRSTGSAHHPQQTTDLVAFVAARTDESAAELADGRCADPSMQDALTMADRALGLARAGQVTPATVRALALLACLHEDHPDFEPHWRRWAR